MKIAVPITAQYPEEARLQIKRAKSFGADLVELRFDYIKVPTPDRLTWILERAELPVIYTNRHIDEVGSDRQAGFMGSERERLVLLETALDSGVDYVDIEFRHLLATKRKGSKTKYIVSWHDFERTPENLDEIRQQLSQSYGDIIKIATKANNPIDNLSMLELVSNRSRTMIGLCMGPLGIPTRVLGPVYGGYLTYAALTQGKESAPGQLTIKELKEAWKLLKLE